jgi:hypothetical protein
VVLRTPNVVDCEVPTPSAAQAKTGVIAEIRCHAEACAAGNAR